MPTLWSVLTGAVAVVIVCVAVGAGVATAIGFLLVAFFFYLAPYTSAAGAAVATGALAFVVALAIVGVFALVARISLARGARRNAPRAARASVAGDSAGRSAGTEGADGMMREAGGWIAENPKAAGLGAFCAGVVLGLNPELRRALADGASAWLRASRRRDRESGGTRDG